MLYADMLCAVTNAATCSFLYSTNGGSSWTTGPTVSKTTATTEVVSLPAGTQLSQVQLGICATATHTISNGSATFHVYDIWTANEVVPSISRVIWWDGSGAGNGGSRGTASNFTFSQYAYGAESAGPDNVTTNTVTVSQGDFAVQWCREASLFSGMTAQNSNLDPVFSSPPNTVSWGTGPSMAQMFYYPSLTAGSQSFTCSTTGTLDSGFSAVVLIYHHSGGTPTLTSNAIGSCASGTSCTSGAITVTGPSLVVYCGTQSTTSAVFTADSIGASSATLRGVSNSSLATASDAGCEDATFTAPQGTITGSLTSNTAATWGITAAVFQ